MLKLEFELPLTRTYWFYVHVWICSIYIYFFTRESLYAFRSFTMFVHIYSFSFSFCSSLFSLSFRHILLHFIFALVGFGFHRLLLNSAGCLWRIANSLVMCSPNSVFHSLSFFIAADPFTIPLPHGIYECKCETGPRVWYASCAYVANESNVAEVMRYLTEKNYKTCR